MAYEVRALIIHGSERNIKYFVLGNVVHKLSSSSLPSFALPLEDRYNLIVYVQDVFRVKCLLFKWHKTRMTLYVVESLR
jgi:hypothetical protein